MTANRILVPIDFTTASDKAIDFGKFLARKSNSDISLLHVFENEDLSLGECETRLKTLADEINSEEEFNCDYICEKGNIFNVIPAMFPPQLLKVSPTKECEKCALLTMTMTE